MIEQQEPTFEDLMDSFEIQVPMDEGEIPPVVNVTLDTPPAKTPEEIAAEEAAETKTPEEIAAEEAAAEEPPAKTPEEIAAEIAAKEAAEEGTPPISGRASYKDLVAQYMERGTWDKELAVEGEDGETILVSELEEIDEDTFFQLEEGIKAQQEEDDKGKFLSIEGVSKRKKLLLDIINEGGELSSIFKTQEELEAYVNPFEGADLDNVRVQESIYYNALVKYNKLDGDTAQLVVDKAKKDLTLDSKVQSFVTKFNSDFDKYVEEAKEKVIADKVEAKKEDLTFRKALNAEYKKLNVKDTLARRLSTMATAKKGDDYEIDEVYGERMKDPAEAAELVLFLTDKKAYLEAKLSEGVIKVHKGVRQAIKLAPKGKATKPAAPKPEDTPSEFNMKV